MSAPLPFQPNRFRSAAAHYLAGRPPYPPGCGRTDQMVRELQVLLRRIAPRDTLTEVLECRALIARRPAA